MKKRILSVLLAICMCIALFANMTVSAATYEGHYEYEVVNNEATITKASYWLTGSITLPSTLGGYPVTSIGEYAFFECKKITSVIIPDSVTRIGGYAFSDCTCLENIIIGSGVAFVGDDMLSGCYNLESITVSKDNLNYSSAEGVLFNKNKTSLIRYPENKGGTYTIPKGVVSIEREAFFKCGSLTSVTIPDSVTSIGFQAFCYCTGLTSIVIPDGVTTIENGVFNLCSNIASVIIGDGVTSIGSSTFKECKNLIDVIVGDSVISIGSSAFAYCYNLTNITLGENVKTISGSAFYCCESLSNINLPDNLTSIGSSAFAKCTSLTSIAIPNGVMSITSYAFQDCVKLKSVIFSDNVINIFYKAFYGCGITDVYYSGSEDIWKNIYIQSGNESLATATKHYNSTGTIAPEYHDPIQKSGTFSFASGKGSANFQYDDNYFQNSSYTYNHDLAKMSMRLALSAFGKNITIAGATDNSCEAKDYSKAYINAENLLKKLGFVSNEDTQGAIAHNEWYENKPEQNSIGVIVGRKHIKYPDYNCTLIAVAIRGGGYEAEWGGNFNVGTDEYHAGFELARNQVIDFIKKYIKEQGISGNIKLWITGYSRAGATANLTAAYLDENPEALGSNVMLYTDDIYAYCFEPPMGIKNPDNESGLYNNIFSIVNEHDFVPMVAMRQWGFDRYGITKYLPTPSSTYRYFNLEADMEEELEKYLNERYIVDDFKFEYILSSWARGKDVGMQNMQGFFLDKIIYKLADAVKSPTYYEENFQNVIMEIMKNPSINSGDFGPILRNIEQELIDRQVLLYLESALVVSNPNLYGWTLYTTVRASVKDALNASGIPVTNKTIDTITEFISSVGIENFYNLVKNIDGIKQGHRPELCMAWLDVIDEDDFSNQRYRSIYLNCPVDLEVYDSNDNLVAAFYNDVPQKIEGSSIIAYLDENGQKAVILPTDEEFRTEIIATDDGEVTYSVQEQNAATGATRVVNYNKMSMKKNDTLTGTAENLNETEVATYALTSNSITVEEPEVIENAMPVAITSVAEGNGNVSGGGSLLKGEYAQLIATPFENETFLGWYDGDTVVSSESTYRFQVAEVTTLTAKFTENTCEILYLTDDEDVVIVDRILKGSKVTFPSMTQNPNYMILDIYTDVEYTTLADENTTYSEDAVLYAKVLTKDEWVQFDEVNYKLVVYTPTAMNNIQLIVALYEGEKLLELKPNVVNLVVGKNEFENQITNTGTADTLKIFVWNGLSTLKPLFKNCIVDLK